MINRLPGILFHVGVHIASFFGHLKAKKWIAGRINSIPNGNFDVWVHASSLGEYWMIKTLIQSFEKNNKSVFVTVFSPSAWDIVSKNEKNSGFIPSDRLNDINLFLDSIKPKFAVFAKYDLWPLMSKALIKRQIPYAIAFAEFTPNHHALWRWNILERSIYKGAIGIGHQTKKSLQLWIKSEFNNGFYCGDGRFDYVWNSQKNWEELKNISDFKDGKNLLIAGSSWRKEESLLLPLVLKFPKIKFAFAPHDINRVSELVKTLSVPYVLLSKIDSYPKDKISKAAILIVDTIGQLQQLYGHSKYALIGGGFRNGLHNILEALTFGNVITFGPEVRNHWEALSCGANILSLSANSNDVEKWLSELEGNKDLFSQKKISAQAFIHKNIGASKKVMDFIFAKNLI